MLKIPPISRTEEDWSALTEIVWISLIAIVQATPHPWLESVKKGQCVVTAVYSPLHCKQSQFQPASTSPEAQQTHRLLSKVGLHAARHACSPTRRGWASCVVPCLAEVPLGLYPWTRACWMTASTCASIGLNTPSAEGLRTCCIHTWGLWSIRYALHFVWPPAPAASCCRLWDCSDQQQDIAVRLQPCSFSFSARLLPTSACACSQCT